MNFGQVEVKFGQGTDDNRCLGAAVGTNDFKESYVDGEISKWVQDIEQLSTIAVEEPHLALAAYTKGLCHRWSFIQQLKVSATFSADLRIVSVTPFFLQLLDATSQT